MKRRSWLALVVLVLLGLNATMLVHSARASRIDDDYALAFDDDDASPCEAPPLIVIAELPPAATIVDEVPLAVSAGRDDSILAIAPKTSPPR